MHTNIALGFLFGIVSAVFFSLYIVPQKLVRVDSVTFVWTLGLGVLASALVPFAFAGFPCASTWPQRAAALLCGAGWALGTMAFSAGVRHIGLALAAPIKNTTGVLGTLVGLVFLQEWKTTDPWLCTMGSILIVAAAIAIGQTGDQRETTSRATARGVALSLAAAACYASYLYPMKLVVAKVWYWEFTPWMAAGIVLTASVALLFRPRTATPLRAHPPGTYGLLLLGGVAWTLALYSLAASMLLVDLSVAWSLAQLNTLPAVFLGIMAFREIRYAEQRGRIILGLVAATAGTLLLGFSKSG